MTARYSLTTLGSVDLTTSGGQRVMSVCAQPKRLALLVYLVVEGRWGPVSRDRVAAVFWPETNQNRSKANLRNAVHFLRRSLGADVIEAVGAALVVKPGTIRCDALEALGSDEVQQFQAIATFFEGFHVRGGAWAFEDWVDGLRRSALNPTAGRAEPGPRPMPNAEPGPQVSPPPRWPRARVPVSVIVGVVSILATGFALEWRSSTETDPDGARARARDLYDQAVTMPVDRDRDANLGAEELLIQAIRIDSTFADAYAWLALVLGARAMFIGGTEQWADSATRIAERAIRVDPDAALGYRALSYAHFQQSRFQDAMAVGLRYLAFEPSHPLILNNLGFIAIYRGNHYDAIKWGLEAIAESPAWVVPRTLVALSLSELGRTDEALAWLASSYEADETWPPTPSFEVSALLRAGRLAEAERRLDEIGSTDPNVRATVAVAGGDLQRALAYLHESYGRAPDYMPPYGISTKARLGIVLHELGRADEAEPLLVAAVEEAHREIEEGNESKNYRLELASIQAVRGNLDSAVSWLREAYRFGWRDDELFLIRPGLDPLEGDVRFEGLLAQIARAREQSLSRLDREGIPGPPPPVPATVTQ